MAAIRKRDAVHTCRYWPGPGRTAERSGFGLAQLGAWTLQGEVTVSNVVRISPNRSVSAATPISPDLYSIPVDVNGEEPVNAERDTSPDVLDRQEPPCTTCDRTHKRLVDVVVHRFGVSESVDAHHHVINHPRTRRNWQPISLSQPPSPVTGNVSQDRPRTARYADAEDLADLGPPPIRHVVLVLEIRIVPRQHHGDLAPVRPFALLETQQAPKARMIYVAGDEPGVKQLQQGGDLLRGQVNGQDLGEASHEPSLDTRRF